MILPGIKIPWQLLICAGVVGIALWFVYDLGRDHNEEKWQAKVKTGQKIVDELKAKQGNITISGEIRYIETVKVIKEKGNVIEKQIPIYIPVDTPDLPGGFRVLHDSAALGTFPGAAEDGLPVPVRTATETINRNYQICHQWKSALDEQVLWARQQREVYLSECKRLKLSCS